MCFHIRPVASMRQTRQLPCLTSHIFFFFIIENSQKYRFFRQFGSATGPRLVWFPTLATGLHIKWSFFILIDMRCIHHFKKARLYCRRTNFDSMLVKLIPTLSNVSFFIGIALIDNSAWPGYLTHNVRGKPGHIDRHFVNTASCVKTKHKFVIWSAY